MRVAAAVVVVAVAAFGPNAAFAQTEEARVLITASAGFQSATAELTDTGTFPLYDEAGALVCRGRRRRSVPSGIWALPCG